MNRISLASVTITDPMWQERQRTVIDVVLPYQWEILNDRVPGAAKSHCVQNFRIAAGLAQGEHYGMVFQDTDLYKWIEAVAYALTLEKNDALETACDSAIELIEAAQCEDGYLHTYYQLAKSAKRWTNLREGHEMYCAGHLMEAAAAYARATGKTRLLTVACRFADHIDSLFGYGKEQGFPGHPEIELGLLRLYEQTGEKRYLELARYFLCERGKNPDAFEAEKNKPGYEIVFSEITELDPSYYQLHKPITQQEQASGHAVRAAYLYAAATELARITGDETLKQACIRLFDNIVNKQMHVTGGIGSSARGEQFTTDYDLPPDSAYCESCASVGLCMLAVRMWELTGDERCYDIWERSLYNTVLAGMGLDGKHYFYVNPLQAMPTIDAANPMLWHVKTTRQPWFGVACCPPNIARMLLNMGSMLYARDNGELDVLAHIASNMRDGETEVSLQRQGDDFTLRVHANSMKIRLRVPEGMTLTGIDSPVITHAGGQAEYRYRLTPRTRLVYPNPSIPQLAGKVCVLCGQTAYCAEQADNAAPLWALHVDENTDFEEKRQPGALYPDAITVQGTRERIPNDGALYTQTKPAREACEIKLIPYSRWANRQEGQMTVWLNA